MKTDNLSRENFNELYDAVIHDILMLKDCNISIKQMNEITSYQVDFIVFVFSINTTLLSINICNIYIFDLKSFKLYLKK